MKHNLDKTNVMRILDQKHIKYETYHYTDVISGIDVANVLGENPSQVFKTLVTVGHSKELNLKKAANAVKEKSVEMIKSKELLPLTGYIHGGCSPIGMKKQFKTIIDISAKELLNCSFSFSLFSAASFSNTVVLYNSFLSFENSPSPLSSIFKV